MYFVSDPMYTAIQTLMESDSPTRKEELKIQAVLEDTQSPVTNKYLEKLYDSVIQKSHIDFDNIPESKGDIVQYVGYTNMIEVLENILRVASDNRSQSVIDYVNTIKEAISNMRILSQYYKKAFLMNHTYLMMEYNTFVYTIIQAVSTVIYEFVDYIKRPDKDVIEITLKNTKYRANTYYIDQLRKFNIVNKKMNYGKYLESMLQNGKENFTGATAVGIGAIVMVALSIVPITRELLYRFYNVRSNISQSLAQQAYFLEINKAAIEANNDFDKRKKAEILIKQEKAKNLCLKISDKLRVEHIKSMNSSKAVLRNDNKLLTLDNIKKEVDNAPLTLL